MLPIVTHQSDQSDGNTCPETITRIYKVEDNCGNFSLVTQIIVINDITSPIFTTTNLADESEVCMFTPNTPTASDNCESSINGMANVIFPITSLGTTVVTWTYSDGCNEVEQQQNINIESIDVSTTVTDPSISVNSLVGT